MNNKKLIKQLKQNFDDHANLVDGIEVWFARDLQNLLGYEKWQMFERVITRAETACEESGNDPAAHFTVINKPAETGKGAQIEIKDLLLTRYACYLIAQNGDPRKKEIAFAMTYFAVQTRKMEVLEQRFGEIERILARDELTVQEKLLAKLSFDRGVDEKGISRIRSKGDQALFTYSASAMKRKLGVPKNRPLADFLPRVTIAGKAFATEITNFNIDDKKLMGEKEIMQEHVQRNKDVRDILLKAKITPEKLPPSEDIKKVGRRLKKDEKKLTKK